jgi:hypothetical protein
MSKFPDMMLFGESFGFFTKNSPNDDVSENLDSE